MPTNYLNTKKQKKYYAKPATVILASMRKEWKILLITISSFIIHLTDWICIFDVEFPISLKKKQKKIKRTASNSFSSYSLLYAFYSHQILCTENDEQKKQFFNEIIVNPSCYLNWLLFIYNMYKVWCMLWHDVFWYNFRSLSAFQLRNRMRTAPKHKRERHIKKRITYKNKKSRK